MAEPKATKIETTREGVIDCRALRPKAFIPADDCAACEHHKGFMEIAPEQNGRPATTAALCGLPSLVKVQSLVRKAD